MTIAEWCLFASVMTYLLTLAPAKLITPRTFDNSRPRDPDFYADPRRARLQGAHQNGMEAFPFFAAAVLLAEYRGAPQTIVDWLAVAFVVTRLLYVFAYVGNRPTVRTMLWNAAFAFNAGIFFLAGFGVEGARIATGIGLGWALVLAPLMKWLEGFRSSDDGAN